MTVTAAGVADLRASLRPLLELVREYGQDRPGPDAANFMFGNPTEMPLPGLVDALATHARPLAPDWFAYKTSEPESRRIVSTSLRNRLGVDVRPDDVFMTNGGFAAIAVALRAVVEPGDEVVFLSPPWFFYELLIASAGGVPVRVRLDAPAFELDVDAIEAAITERTAAMIVNTPHNPSGRVYSPHELERLAAVLSAASRRHGRPIRLLSDEAYNRIVFDGLRFHTPMEFYPETLLLYSYGKTLLAPGQRMGYVALASGLTARDDVADAIELAQIATGWAYPNALLQHAIADLEALSIDVGRLEWRRDRMVDGLRALGYETTWPQGTFYVMAKAPIDDDAEFARRLRRHDTWVLPGSVVEVPGWFRISLTANDEMVERGLVGFERVLDKA